MDITPRQPQRPLRWSDAVLDLHDYLIDYPEPVYIVGGAVRDAWLGYPLKDIDLVTTTGQGVRLARRIADWLNGDIFIMDAERDVSRVLTDTPDGRLNIDVTGLRGADLLEDLTERDFTLNALAVDLRADITQLIDPLNGERDLKDKILRLCAPHAIATDPIRALRAVRVSLQLSARILPYTADAIRASAPRLGETSPERLRDEFFRLLESKRPVAALRVMDALGLAQAFVPVETLKQGRIARLDGWSHTLLTIEKLRNILDTISPRRTDTTAAVFDMGMIVMGMDRYRRRLQAHLMEPLVSERSTEGLALLGALLHNLPLLTTGVTPARLAEDYAQRLRLSNAEKRRLTSAITHYLHPVFHESVTPLSAHRYWRQAGASGIDAALLMLADHLATANNMVDQDAWIALVNRVEMLFGMYFTQYETVIEPPVLLDGNRLKAEFSLKPGRLIGDLMDALREAQVVGEVSDEASALAFARAYLASRDAGPS